MTLKYRSKISHRCILLKSAKYSSLLNKGTLFHYELTLTLVSSYCNNKTILTQLSQSDIILQNKFCKVKIELTEYLFVMNGSIIQFIVYLNGTFMNISNEMSPT
jgi:hypothetical protein